MNKRTITVKLDTKSVEVSKLPLGKYAELLKALKEIPKKIPELSGATPDQVLSRLPEILAEAWDDVINIIPIATPLTKEEASEIGLDEAVRLFVAVYEVNNYAEIYENIKKALARPEAEKPQIGSGTGGQ